MINYKKKMDETYEEYLCRICEQKASIGNWEDVKNVLNAELGYNYTSSKYRKEYTTFARLFDAMKEKITSEEISSKMDELYKQQIKTRDVIREKNKTLRDEARIETLIEAVSETADSMPKFELKYNIVNGAKEAILMIGDWHYGALVDNFYNKYDTRIAIDRVAKLKVEVLNYCRIMGVKKLNILNLSDNFEGNIHVSCRVSSEIDIVTQIMQVSELIAEFLKDVSLEVETVNYRSVLDNHSRANKKYNEHIEKENFSRLIDFYLKNRLKDTKVNLIFDNIDENIGLFNLDNGKSVAFVHGHLDKKDKVLVDLSIATNKIIDYVCLGHYHDAKSYSTGSSKTFINGTLKGVDSYALNNRLFSKPSQTLLVFDNENIINFEVRL